MSDFVIQFNGRFVANAERLALALSIFVLLVGALVLAGWLFAIESFKALYGDITMKANTALGLTFAGASSGLLCRETLGPRLRRVGQLLATLVLLIGALTLSEHLIGWNLGIDELLFTELPGALATTSPGRMGPNASASFTLCGIALLLFYSGQRKALAQSLSALMGLIALLTLIGYAYQVEALYGIAKYTGIAFHTTLAFFALSLALLSSHPQQGIVAAISSAHAGGIIARRLLIPAMLVPFLLNWLRLLGQQAGYYDLGFGSSLMAVMAIALFTFLIWFNASKLNHIERQRLAAEAEARAQAEKANRLKDEFLATVSHELRTPLNAVLGWATLLGKGDLDAEMVSRALEAIERNTKAQAQLIEDLLDVSRIASGKLHLEMQPVNLEALIQMTVEAMRPAIAAKGITLQMNLPPAIGEFHGDAQRLQQVILNLLSNAVKFTPEHGHIEVNLEYREAQAQISVSDTGSGIAGDFLPYIFDRFQQADSTSTRKHGGLGLGLSIARHLVEAHGGTITAFSDGDGAGARFVVRLPLPTATVKSSAANGNALDLNLSPQNNLDAEALNGRKVLAVDDDANTREMVSGVLHQYGIQVRTASSAKEALDILAIWSPDVMICDLGMPEEDGYSLIDKVRQWEAASGKLIPAIALTGFAQVEERERALAAGFQLFLGKPIEAQELLVALAQLLNPIGQGKGV
ncbi:MAG: response regulator [Acidobacteria bacterium]|nr:response regulator [Acidobacteriota bacterium]